jgi:hypothetical protein
MSRAIAAAAALSLLAAPAQAASPKPPKGEAAKLAAEKARRAGVPSVRLPRGGGEPPITLPTLVTTGPDGTNWFIDDTSGSPGAFAGFCDGSPGLGIIDAGSSDSGDAYDNGYPLWVNGAIFTVGTTVDLTGTTLTAGPLGMSGLNVTRELFFSPTRQVMRVLDSFQNPGGGPINVTVEIPVNFGSDGSTVVQDTSSGDTTFTVADRWLITSDTFGPSDPVNTTVLYGPGTPALTPASVTETVFDCAAPNGAGWTFNLSVPAGATRRLLYFAGLEDMVTGANTVAGAQANVVVFNDVLVLNSTTDLLSGLTLPLLLEVVNWDMSPLPVELQSFEVK